MVCLATAPDIHLSLMSVGLSTAPAWFGVDDNGDGESSFLSADPLLTGCGLRQSCSVASKIKTRSFRLGLSTFLLFYIPLYHSLPQYPALDTSASKLLNPTRYSIRNNPLNSDYLDHVDLSLFFDLNSSPYSWSQ